MQTPGMVSSDPGVSEAQYPVKADRPQVNPVSRLLAQVSKSVGVYAGYQMEEGVWRKLAI